jgi:hypothetical protein
MREQAYQRQLGASLLAFGYLPPKLSSTKGHDEVSWETVCSFRLTPFDHCNPDPDTADILLLTRQNWNN